MRFDTMDTRLEWRLAPELIFVPETLDFGCLPQNTKAVRELYAYNLSGPVDSCSVVGSEEASWVGVVHVQSVHGYKQACVRIAVEVDTSLLLPGRIYNNWLDVRFGTFRCPIQIAVEVVAGRMALLERWRLFQAVITPVLAVILLSSFLSWCLTVETPLSSLLALIPFN